MYGTLGAELQQTLREIEDAGLYKRESPLTSPQGPRITTGRGDALNFCANDYLGLASEPEVEEAAARALREWGFGMASVRFICGTQETHTALESALSDFLGTEDTILYSSCFDANGGVFEVLFGEEDAIVSDELNHASLIDGIRLSKARRYRYRNADLGDLRVQLEAARAAAARRVVIVTDGVFSMDGTLAPLAGICDLADEFEALVLVDDSHAVGFVGENGRGTPERFGVADRVDILTGTLGKALGGASGGYVSSRREIVALLRQRSRPYLFSNAVAPSVAAGSLKALEIARGARASRERLRAHAALFRELMTEEGFDLLPGEHPITPVMFPGDEGARLAGEMSAALRALGVYVIPLSFPVVPRGKARIRVQLSAAHTEDDVRACVAAFVTARERTAQG